MSNHTESAPRLDRARGIVRMRQRQISLNIVQHFWLTDYWKYVTTHLQIPIYQSDGSPLTHAVRAAVKDAKE